MRITLRLDERLLARVRRCAVRSGLTVSGLMEAALRARLGRPGPRGRGGALRLRTVGGGGLLPGVDLDDGASLGDVMDF
jgi:hypothetical protein